MASKTANTEEKNFAKFLEKLKFNKIVIDYSFQPKSFILTDDIMKIRYNKGKKEEYRFMKQHIYTPDFIIQWCDNNMMLYDEILQDTDNDLILKEKIFYYKHIKNKSITYIELKPDYDRYNMTRTFKDHIQPLIYEKYKICVQLIKTSDFKKIQIECKNKKLI